MARFLSGLMILSMIVGKISLIAGCLVTNSSMRRRKTGRGSSIFLKEKKKCSRIKNVVAPDGCLNPALKDKQNGPVRWLPSFDFFAGPGVPYQGIDLCQLLADGLC